MARTVLTIERLLLAGLGLSGAAALIYEVAWTRALTLGISVRPRMHMQVSTDTIMKGILIGRKVDSCFGIL